MGNFKLSPLSTGNNPNDWDLLQDVLNDSIIEPDASYNKYSEVITTLGGSKYGRGFATATWLFNGITPKQRYALRQICPDLSVKVYIETMTNEFDVDGNRLWIQASAVMNWAVGEEEIENDYTIDLEITFTEIVEI